MLADEKAAVAVVVVVVVVAVVVLNNGKFSFNLMVYGMYRYRNTCQT